MSTFYSRGVVENLCLNLAELVSDIDVIADVHTITLVLNGQHGGFDVTVLATDEDMDERTFRATSDTSGAMEEAE